MKNQIQQFHSTEFGTLEVLMLDGKPYFPATECAKILGYSTPRHAITRHCKGGMKRAVGVQTGEKSDGSPATQSIEKTYIPEGDLYRLIVRSKLPEAERFEKLVFDEILPSIRKHGAYVTEEVLEAATKIKGAADELFQRLREEKAENAASRDRVEALAPKAQYCENILLSDGALPISVIAKDYGMGGVKFNKLLQKMGIQFNVAGVWLLYREYAGKGYTKSHTHYPNCNSIKLHTRWTQKGRMFLYEELKKVGILPIMESGYDAKS